MEQKELPEQWVLRNVSSCWKCGTTRVLTESQYAKLLATVPERRRDEWRANYDDATGDSRRPAVKGPAPPGWSSWQPQPEEQPSAASHAASAPLANGGEQLLQGLREASLAKGSSPYATWSRLDYGATHLLTTIDPANGRNGSVSLGPRWQKVVRRVTYDIHTNAIPSLLPPWRSNLRISIGFDTHGSQT